MHVVTIIEWNESTTPKQVAEIGSALNDFVAGQSQVR